MLVSDFDYALPEELIAQHPPAVRGSSRMLTLDRVTGRYEDRQFAELPELLRAGDLLVLNDSRVLPSRLYGVRGGLTTQHNSPAPSGVVEVLLVAHIANPEGHNDWRALVRPAKKMQTGETISFARNGHAAPLLRATVIAEGDFGERTLRFDPCGDFFAHLEELGHLPLPPYIHRDRGAADSTEDRERYQTVYARERGSAAAPTAGLHFTPEILRSLHEHGVETAYVTLHVGLGTFQPVRVDRTEEIHLHAEHYSLTTAASDALRRAKEEGRRIIAVGTTTTRTLEHIARVSREIAPHSGSTALFLSPGLNDEFRLVDGLLTNFHLPQSTLLMLVSAFAGRERVLAAYQHAVEQRYRFFSYGDCMLIT